ncbi:MAG TPA: hypothetical protein VKJ01_07080, partial [Candidatus Solibacter sp.]|nr:hypothetical protein [Candidatus Solibacter sp.]
MISIDCGRPSLQCAGCGTADAKRHLETAAARGFDAGELQGRSELSVERTKLRSERDRLSAKAVRGEPPVRKERSINEAASMDWGWPELQFRRPALRWADLTESSYCPFQPGLGRFRNLYYGSH